MPIEIQLGSNAVTLTPDGWKLGEYLLGVPEDRDRYYCVVGGGERWTEYK